MRHFLLGRTRKFTPESRYPLTDLSRALSHPILCLWNNCGFKRNGLPEFAFKSFRTPSCRFADPSSRNFEMQTCDRLNQRNFTSSFDDEDGKDDEEQCLPSRHPSSLSR